MRFIMIVLSLKCGLCLLNFQDFYLDLVEDNRKITPRDYLELALRPVQGGGRDLSSKNEVPIYMFFMFLFMFVNISSTQGVYLHLYNNSQIRESIRALFPDRECFTLVRPLNNENELQRLDQISVRLYLYLLFCLLCILFVTAQCSQWLYFDVCSAAEQVKT